MQVDRNKARSRGTADSPPARPLCLAKNLREHLLIDRGDPMRRSFPGFPLNLPLPGWSMLAAGPLPLLLLGLSQFSLMYFLNPLPHPFPGPDWPPSSTLSALPHNLCLFYGLPFHSPGLNSGWNVPLTSQGGREPGLLSQLSNQLLCDLEQVPDPLWAPACSSVIEELGEKF